MKNETIASITTPIGEGGIGVIQVSGPNSLEIVNKVFKGKKLKDLINAESMRIYYGDIYYNGRPVDEVIVNVLREQDSFTGEDLVEVNCHGGILAVKKTLESIVSAGAKEVHWEELANRPLINSKIDRIQEEALREIPKAKTKLGVKVLLDQYNGALSLSIHKTIEGIGKCDNNKKLLYDTNNALREILATAAFGCAITSPQKLIITGKPNAGKSTLFNSLLKEDRLITHKEPGTTRDAIDEMFSIDGIPITIVDTAGIRETEHEVERLGILESRKQLAQADKIIVVFDNSKPVEKEDEEIIKLINTLQLKKADNTHNKISVFAVLNKTDLPCKLDAETLIGKIFGPICQVSALNGDGLPTLEETLISEFKGFTEYTPEKPIIFTKRQQDYVSKALNTITRCIQEVKGGKEPSNYSDLLNEIKQNLLNSVDDSHKNREYY
ncbi:tRNA modification GTPase MnmE [Candidatus Scalindua japonica]|uniref:tRNA modification GTPase MnmE n=1 Tax=Candidatus Scalindua japonica TaxID=1284222 RepID=A0A286TWA3_9BACT|nr:GTPase [Candidatus Scalindua japonica]GAX60169.1 tRNA modification GTPase MnmE [Candidatus Scalindua japonica]